MQEITEKPKAEQTIRALITKAGVEEKTEIDLRDSFLPFFEQAKEWKEKAEALVVTDASQTDLMKEARIARLAIKSIRVETEKTRKRLKQDSLRKGKAIDGIANVIKYQIEPIEEHLQEQENFIQIQEAKQKKQLREDRLKALEPFEVNTQFVQLGEMSSEAWEEYFSSVKAAHAAMIQAAEREFKERAERERLDAIERAREKRIAPLLQFYGSENESPDVRNMGEEKFEELVKELEGYKAEKEAEEERIRQENERLKKAEAERKTREEAERKEREEKSRKEREEFEAKLKKEREERERAEAEIRAKKLEEERARKQAEKEARAAALAPDKDKLLALARSIEGIKLPDLKDPKARQVSASVESLISKVVKFIEEKTETL